MPVLKNKTLFTEQSMMIVVPAGKGLQRPEQSRTSPCSHASSSSAGRSIGAAPISVISPSASVPILPSQGYHSSSSSMAATPETNSNYNFSRGSSIASWTPVGSSSGSYLINTNRQQIMHGIGTAGSRNVASSDSQGMGPIAEDPPDASNQFRHYKPVNAPPMPLTTPLPAKIRRRRYPHATAMTAVSMDHVPKPQELDKYEGPYNIIARRLLSQAPPDMREELSKVVAVVLDRCNDLEDRMLENEKRAQDLNRQKLSLTHRVQQLSKLLANSKSSLRAVGNKAKELEGEVVFRTTVINKQVESINKLSGKNLKLASALQKLNTVEDQMGMNGGASVGGLSATSKFLLSDSSTHGMTNRKPETGGEEGGGPQAFSVKKEIIMTVSAVTKENLELVTKTRILDEDNRNFKEQLRVVNEKLRAIYTHLDEYGERSDRVTLRRLAEEALAQDPENHIKMSTIQSRKVSILELLDGEEDKLGKIINNPAVDSVITLIQFRNLVKLIAAISACGVNTDDVLRELLSRATCRLLGCETVVLYVVDKDDSMWSVSMSNPSRRSYHSTSKGIAGYAMRKGDRVNTDVPKDHPAFDPQVDGFTTLVPRSLLSIPVRDQNGKPVAVLQALNKCSNKPQQPGQPQQALSPQQQQQQPHQQHPAHKPHPNHKPTSPHPPPSSSPASPSSSSSAPCSFTCVDELLGEFLVAQAYILLTSSKISTVTEWKFETCLKFLTMPGNHLKSLVIDVLFPTTAQQQQEPPDKQLVWTIKKLEQMLEEVLRARQVKIFIVDSVDKTLGCLVETMDPNTYQKVKVKKTFKADEGFAGHMAHSSGKMVIHSPQKDPRVNTEVDLDTGSEPLHSCTIQAVSGQVIAVVQVGGSSFDALNDRGGSVGGSGAGGVTGQKQHSIASLSLLDALDLVCEQLAPYLETTLQVLSPHFMFSKLVPRRGVSSAAVEQALELEALRRETQALKEQAESSGQQLSKLSGVVSGNQAAASENEDLKAKLKDTETQLTAANESLAALTQSEEALRAELEEMKKKAAAQIGGGGFFGFGHRSSVVGEGEDLKKQFEETRRALQQTETAKIKAAADLASVTFQLQTVMKEKEDASEEAAAAKKEVEACKHRHTELEKEVASLIQAAAAAKSQAAEKEEARTAIDAVTKQLTESQVEVTHLKEQLQRRKQSMEAQQAASTAEVEDLRSQVASLKEQMAAYSQQYYEAPAALEGGGGASDWDPYSDDQGNIYYVNRVTGETSWERPDDSATSAQPTTYAQGYESVAEAEPQHDQAAPSSSSAAASPSDMSASPKSRYRIDL